MKTIITVQHTEAMHHLNGMMGAWTDWPLTELGRQHADNIGRTLKAAMGTARFLMFSSDLLRTRQTAEAITHHTGVEPALRSEIREINVGIDQPTTSEWFHLHRAPSSGKPYGPDYRPFPNAESGREFYARVHVFMEEALAAEAENIVVVSHGVTLRYFFKMWMHDDLDAFDDSVFATRPGGVSRLYVGDDGRRGMTYLNDMSFREGMATRGNG